MATPHHSIYAHIARPAHLSVICLIAVLAPLSRAETLIEPARIRLAVDKSIALLQSTGKVWFERQSCTSCHHSALPTLALTMARRHGVTINEALARDHFQRAYVYLTDVDYIAQGINATNFTGDSYALWAVEQAGLPPNNASAALVQMLASQQRPDGHWRTLDVRPPQSGSLFTATALSIRALNSYSSPKLDAASKQRVERARRWLETSQPVATEDEVFRLLGAKWSGTLASHRKEYARHLVTQQRPDGGWSQIPSRTSDAYATGQVLFALIEGGGISVEDQAIERGVAYLLETQFADGSWLVPSRIHDNAPLSPPYFETGFPHGKDQIASCSGTSWAVMALSIALPSSNVQPLGLADLIPTQDTWVETALFGSPSEVGKLDPNAQTKLGTTVLMLAASDPTKVKVLLGRGANANARAKSGFSALMIASSFGGNARTVQLLMDRGAVIEPPVGAKVLFDRSPLIQAIISGDLEIVKLLVEREADVRRKAQAFGGFVIQPLMLAVYYNDLQTARYLVHKGALADEADKGGITPLERAATFDYSEMVALLAQFGGDPNHIDKKGMTPLIWASTIEFGNAETAKKLLAAGARVDLSGVGGVTPRAQAEKYGLSDVVMALQEAHPKDPR